MKVIAASLFFGICGVLGDYVESRWKRNHDIKDSGDGLVTGEILKGHGGAGDRFDALPMALWGWTLVAIFVK
jgi:CDP-diglyceride synthetase